MRKKSIIVIVTLILTGLLGYVLYSYFVGKLIQVIQKHDDKGVSFYLSIPFIEDQKIDRNIFVKRKFFTPLMVACESYNYEAVEKLLEKGANANFHNDHFHHPITEAIIGLNERNSDTVIKIIDILVAHGAKIKELNNPSPLQVLSMSYTVLTSEEEKKVALKLTKYLYSLGTESKEILYYAAEYDQIEIIKFLIEEHKINIDFAPDSSDTDSFALIAAVRQSHYECAKYLVDMGFQPYKKAGSGKSALDYAIERKDDKMIKILKKLN